MRSHALAALLLAGPCPLLQAAASRPQALAVTHVTVLDCTGAPPRRGTTVVIEGGRITALGPAAEVAVPPRARVLDGRGKYLIPGLWDMHAHVTHEPFRELFLAHGVTGVRHMFSFNPLYSPRSWRAGRSPAPRLVATDVILDGEKTAFPYWLTFSGRVCKVRCAEEARAKVRELRLRGDDFVKVHSNLSPLLYRAVAAAARKEGLPLVGHVPHLVSAKEASDIGQKSIEHLSGVALACSSAEDLLR
jgi:cytosine/adenosine deaminase-related metal-dependent hydrolase